jgi:hypothetical protein
MAGVTPFEYLAGLDTGLALILGALVVAVYVLWRIHFGPRPEAPHAHRPPAPDAEPDAGDTPSDAPGPREPGGPDTGARLVSRWPRRPQGAP